jgi:hypothetical protein
VVRRRGGLSAQASTGPAPTGPTPASLLQARGDHDAQKGTALTSKACVATSDTSNGVMTCRRRAGSVGDPEVEVRVEVEVESWQNAECGGPGKLTPKRPTNFEKLGHELRRPPRGEATASKEKAERRRRRKER